MIGGRQRVPSLEVAGASGQKGIGEINWDTHEPHTLSLSYDVVTAAVSVETRVP